VHAFRTSCAKTWGLAWQIVFFVLCLRFQVSAVRSADTNLGPVVMLIAGGVGMGAWNPCAALFAFTLAVPFLSGLRQTSFLDFPSPLSLVFSGLWMGIAAKSLLRRTDEHFQSLTFRAICRRRALSGAAEDRQSAGELQPSRIPLETKPENLPSCTYYPSLITDILIAAVLLSLAWQFWRHWGSVDLWPVFLNRAVPGYGDPWYFLTAAFVWLQGLVYFRILFSRCVGPQGVNADTEKESLDIAAWIRPFFVAYGVTIAIFFLIQYIFHVPEGWIIVHTPTGLVSIGFQAPYEDISSFGSVAVAVFVFLVSTLRSVPSRRLISNTLGCVGLLVMVVASWSRATWLAGTVFLLLIAVFRLSRQWIVTFIIVTVLAVVAVNANAKRPFVANSPYLSRLATLVSFENPTNKDPTRLNLYKKAARMIQQHPLVGHGIGSFYLKSVDYAQSDDFYAAKPDFTHNVCFQIAAEQGVPIAVLFAGLMTWTIWRGIRAWLKQGTPRHRHSADPLLILGTTLALGAYLETQMTANSLNIYETNQFFLWFLTAATLAISRHERNLKSGTLVCA
jgi:O-antigen ligase